jgi:hypothetical protein
MFIVIIEGVAFIDLEVVLSLGNKPLRGDHYIEVIPCLHP